MKLTRVLMSSVAGAVPMFLLGAVGHGVLLRSYREGTPRPFPMLPILFLSVLLLALCMALVYARVANRKGILSDGLWLGMIFAVAWTVPGGLSRFGALVDVDLGKVFADAAWHLVEEGVGGIVIVLVQSRGARAVEPLPDR